MQMMPPLLQAFRRLPWTRPEHPTRPTKLHPTCPSELRWYSASAKSEVYIDTGGRGCKIEALTQRIDYHCLRFTVVGAIAVDILGVEC